MSNTDKEQKIKNFLRFGQVAVERGFVTEEQLKEVLSEQIANDPYVRLRPRRLIGEIFLEKGWMNSMQIQTVLAEIFEDKE